MYVVMETHSSVVFPKLYEEENVVNWSGHKVGDRASCPGPSAPFPLQLWCFSRCFFSRSSAPALARRTVGLLRWVMNGSSVIYFFSVDGI